MDQIRGLRGPMRLRRRESAAPRTGVQRGRTSLEQRAAVGTQILLQKVEQILFGKSLAELGRREVQRVSRRSGRGGRHDLESAEMTAGGQASDR